MKAQANCHHYSMCTFTPDSTTAHFGLSKGVAVIGYRVQCVSVFMAFFNLLAVTHGPQRGMGAKKDVPACLQCQEKEQQLGQLSSKQSNDDVVI